jgi:hypothetical protein
LVVTFVFLTGWHNSNGSYSFDGKKLNAKKNVNLNLIFASTANVKPLTANRGLRLGVNKINVNLKVSNTVGLLRSICKIAHFNDCYHLSTLLRNVLLLASVGRMK